MNAPCYKCKERQVGCHSSCPKYQEFSAQQQEIYQERYWQGERAYENYRAAQRQKRYSAMWAHRERVNK